MKKQEHLIGFDYSGSGTETFYSYNPSTQEDNEYLFFKVTPGEINIAVEKAATSFQLYRKKSGVEKANFLNAIAEELLNTGDELIHVCGKETGLPAARIEGERMRTVNQLKMFASLLTEGSWVDARIETAIPERVPIPKPDLRFIHIPLGPVVVFGASNFPLAFSVAGGDTASALAAGCTVVVKAHPAHPATSAIVGKCIQEAARKTNMPDGVFSLLFDDGIDFIFLLLNSNINEIMTSHLLPTGKAAAGGKVIIALLHTNTSLRGLQLVKHPLIKAVAFTGSYRAGKALFDTAAARPDPIPVYAEMGSTNPVFILPQAMKERGQEIAAGYSAAVTLGVGQFCTNPGILIHQDSEDGFDDLLKIAFEKTTGGIMLTPNILGAYKKGLQQKLATAGVEQLSLSGSQSGNEANTAVPILLKTDSKVFNSNRQLSEEVFGPTGIVVHVNSKETMLDIAKNLSGHLTATIHGTDEELAAYKELLDILEQKAGRIIINGFPTGVEVCSAMVHGGPFPATTDSKTTSVGTAAIYRFTRPVCYQNLPQLLLPIELRDQNILNIYRLINGEGTNRDIN